MTEITKTKKPRIDVDPRIVEDCMSRVSEERQVIVHCTFQTDLIGIKIRIWRSTFLRDRDSSHRSKLLSQHNISLYPIWTNLFFSQSHSFTLIFEGLPKECEFFDLYENIPEAQGFYTGMIARNETDVYSVEIYA